MEGISMNIGTVGANLGGYLAQWGMAVRYVLWLAALYACGRGGWMLFQQKTRPNSDSSSHAWWWIFGGILLAAVPELMGLGEQTLFGTNTSQGNMGGFLGAQ